MSPENSPIHYGATKEEWNHFTTVLGLEKDLLPCVSNQKATISPQSDMKKVGKTPSRYNKKGWAVGIKEWTQRITTLEDIERWELNIDYGICLQTRLTRAFDVDISHAPTAKAIMQEIFAVAGPLPVRMRKNSSKFLLAFTMAGDYGKRVIKTAAGNIEFLATGQQFVAAGMHDSGVRYEWAGGLPDELPVLDDARFEKVFAMLVEKFAIEPPAEGKVRNAKQATGDAKASTDPIAQFLADNGSVRGTGREGQVFIDCPWKDEHTVDSGPSETAYFCAGTRGYEQGHFKCQHAHCAKRTNEEFIDAFGYGAMDYDDVSTPEDAEKEKKKKARFDFIPIGDYGARPPIKWIVKGILPRGKLALAYGGSGDGKTFAVLDLALSIARGEKWNNRRVNQGRVLYICAEGQGGFTSRVNAYAIDNKIDLHSLDKEFAIIADTPNFRTSNDVKAIIKKAEAWGKIDLIIVDTLAQVTPGADENAGKDMSIALKNTETLAEATGAMVLLIHHAGKDLSRGSRGWSGLKAPLDAEFEISRDKNTRTFWVSKMKDGRDNFGWNFTLIPVNVGTDEDGDAIDSCVVQFSEFDVSSKKEGKKHSFLEDTVLKAGETFDGDATPVGDIVNEAKRNVPRGDEEKAA